MKPRKIRLPHITVKLPALTAKLSAITSVVGPRLPSLRLPSLSGVHLGGGKLVFFSLGSVALGFLLTFFLVTSEGEELVWPDAGAVYMAPSKVGIRLPVDTEQAAEVPRRSQTLQINLPPGIRINEITIKDTSIGTPWLTTVIQIAGLSSTSTLNIDEFVIKNSEFPTMDWANSDIHTWNATSSVRAAGYTAGATAATSTAEVVIGSTRESASYVKTSGTVDRVIILLNAEGKDALISRLTLDGVRASVGAFDADYLEIGTLTFENIQVGDDGDVNSADLVFNSSVNIKNINENILEDNIFIR